MTLHRKFSVIIPCYNDGDKVPRAVASCLSQTLPPHEIIIVDDGSKEETRQAIRSLAESYQNANIKTCFLDKNMGVSVARNMGLTMATGEYMCFLDSDDVWHLDKLKVVNEILHAHLKPVSITHDFTYDWDKLKMPVDVSEGLESRRITFFDLLLRNPITTPSLVIPSLINLKFNEKMRYAEDHDFILRLAKITPIIFLKASLVLISRKLGSKGGLSENSWAMRKGEIRMYVNFAQSNYAFMILLPLFILYSLVKHLRYLILKKNQ